VAGESNGPACVVGHRVTIESADGSWPFDLERIATVIERHRVRCVLIGGASGALHGMVEYLTKDVDLLVRADEENRSRLADALRELGAGDEITAADLVGNSQWETVAGPLDVLVAAAGPNESIVVYADVLPRAEIFEVGDSGVTVVVAGLDDLIRMKEAADRFKDHLALPELRRLRGDSRPDRVTIVDPFEFDIEAGID
jgi:hypothetical protein